MHLKGKEQGSRSRSVTFHLPGLARSRPPPDPAAQDRNGIAQMKEEDHRGLRFSRALRMPGQWHSSSFRAEMSLPLWKQMTLACQVVHHTTVSTRCLSQYLHQENN